MRRATPDARRLPTAAAERRLQIPTATSLGESPERNHAARCWRQLGCSFRREAFGHGRMGDCTCTPIVQPPFRAWPRILQGRATINTEYSVRGWTRWLVG